MSFRNRTTNIIFIPYWIRIMLDRNKLPLKSIFNLVELSKCLTTEDLACLYYVNEKSYLFTSLDHRTNADIIYQSITYSTNEMRDIVVNKISPLLPLVEPIIKDRLLSDSCREINYPNAYEINDLDNDNVSFLENEFVLVTIYPGYFGGVDSTITKINLIKDLMRLFYARRGYDNMANNQLFETYLNTL